MLPLDVRESPYSAEPVFSPMLVYEGRRVSARLLFTDKLLPSPSSLVCDLEPLPMSCFLSEADGPITSARVLSPWFRTFRSTRVFDKTLHSASEDQRARGGPRTFNASSCPRALGLDVDPEDVLCSAPVPLNPDVWHHYDIVTLVDRDASGLLEPGLCGQLVLRALATGTCSALQPTPFHAGIHLASPLAHILVAGSLLDGNATRQFTREFFDISAPPPGLPEPPRFMACPIGTPTVEATSSGASVTASSFYGRTVTAKLLPSRLKAPLTLAISCCDYAPFPLTEEGDVCSGPQRAACAIRVPLAAVRYTL